MQDSSCSCEKHTILNAQIVILTLRDESPHSPKFRYFHILHSILIATQRIKPYVSTLSEAIETVEEVGAHFLEKWKSAEDMRNYLRRYI